MPPLTSPVKTNGGSLDARGVCRPCSVGPVRNPQFAIVRLRASTVSSAEPLTTRSPKSEISALSTLSTRADREVLNNLIDAASEPIGIAVGIPPDILS